MRDIEKDPYDKSEARVAQFLFDLGAGGGDDPIGFIIASHQVLAAERNDLKKRMEHIHKLSNPGARWVSGP